VSVLKSRAISDGAAVIFNFREAADILGRRSPDQTMQIEPDIDCLLMMIGLVRSSAAADWGMIWSISKSLNLRGLRQWPHICSYAI
jgi:hypothetical protein